MRQGQKLRPTFLIAAGILEASHGGDGMTVYLDLVVILNFGVDFLLLIGTNRLCGYPMKPGKAAIAAALGGLYAGCCALPGFSFLGNTLWRLVSLALMSVLAFGWNSGTLRRSVLFVLLSMALGGIALGMGNGGFFGLIASCAAVCLLCIVGFRGRAGGKRFVSVQLTHKGNSRQLVALLDTGNTLKDPITGQSVLVAGADVAAELLGFTREDLAEPVRTMESRCVKGLRLIPYRAVGQPSGMLVATRLDDVRIEGKEACNLVAFAPQILGTGEYQALVGGVL